MSGRGAILLTVLGVVGFLLGSCGGGDGGALATGTRPTVTLPEVTATRPTLTAPTLPAATAPTTDESPVETETQEVPTTEPEVPTTEPEVPTTEPEVPTTEPEEPATEPEVPATEPEVPATEPEVPATEPEEPTTAPVPPITVTIQTETTPAATAPPPTEAAEAAAETEPADETDDNAIWAWLAFAVVLVASSLAGLLIWRRRRARAASWGSAFDELSRRTLVELDGVLAEGSVVTGRIEALAAEARSLERGAPDDAATHAVAGLRGGLAELADTLEADRTLRLASPPPTAEQLSYSTALIRRQVAQLQEVLRPPPSPPGP